MTAVGSWLTDGDERFVLRGILAAAATGATALIDAVAVHRGHPRRAIADAAERAYSTLDESSHAAALAAADALGDQLSGLLETLATGPGRDALVARLRPAEDDYPRVFVAEAVDGAREAYAAAWAAAPTLPPAASRSCRVEAHVATAGLLGSDNELSRPFPRGYRGIVPLLQPQRVWAAWTVLEPGRSAGTAYDGMVWVDDHWAWFPRPYRTLRHLAAGG